MYDGHGNYGASGYGEPDWPIRSRVWLISAFGHTIQTYKRLDTLAGGIPVPNATIDVQEIFSDVPLASIAVSLTTGSPSCDYSSGFFADHMDINFNAGGKYSYLCFKRATDSTTSFVVNVTAVVSEMTEASACPSDWHSVDENVREGTASNKKVTLCYQTATAGDQVLVDVAVAQGRNGQSASCLDGYKALTEDLTRISGGNGEMTLLCGRYEAWTSEVIARAEFSHSDDVKRRLPESFGWSTLLAMDKKDIAAERVSKKRSSVVV